MVGTRAASSYGLRTAYTLGRELGRWGWTVVSGMARGIDAAAHAGALDAGGHSTGVLGTGHDHEYPAENRELYGRMRRARPPVERVRTGRAAHAGGVPRRNRVIAALARGVIVVEAGGKSGALNTADHALDLGREVLAVPGRIDDPGAAGVSAAAAAGRGVGGGRPGRVRRARVAPRRGGRGPGSGDDGGSTQSEGEAAASPDMELLRALTRGPRSPDELAVGLELPVARVLRGLGRLELEGWVERRPGGNFSAVRRPARR